MGKLIVFEGTDGTGKSTQFALLTKRLQNENVSFRRLQFPQYLEPSSALIRMYLNGEFGENPNDVNAYAASTFYAVDRFASYQRVWKNDYASGGLILSDRYTTSNAVHQGGKLEGKAREEFFSWLYDLEFNRMGLPKPDLVLWLDMPVEIAETAHAQTRERHQHEGRYPRARRRVPAQMPRGRAAGGGLFRLDARFVRPGRKAPLHRGYPRGIVCTCKIMFGGSVIPWYISSWVRALSRWKQLRRATFCGAEARRSVLPGSAGR
ncbi:MAG: dTMP kinase [Oscillospiraceae bacterium]